MSDSQNGTMLQYFICNKKFYRGRKKAIPLAFQARPKGLFGKPSFEVFVISKYNVFEMTAVFGTPLFSKHFFCTIFEMRFADFFV